MRVWSIFYGNLSLSQGPTTHFSELARGLVNSGVDFTGYAPAIGRYNGIDQNFKVKYTPTIDLPFIRVVVYDLLLMFRLLFTFPKADIFYVRVAYFSLFTPLLAKFLRKKLVLEINGYVVDDVASKGWTGLKAPLGWLSVWCEKTLHRIADASIIVTETIYNAIHENFKIPKGKLYHIKNGVNIDHFKPLDQEACKKELGFDLNTDYIGYVGCFTGWDGIEHLVRALPAIKKQFASPPSPLSMNGEGEENSSSSNKRIVKALLVGDGDHRAYVESEVKRLGLEQDVIFTGYVPYKELPKYLNCFTVAVAPYGGSDSIETRNNKGLSSLKCLEYTGTGLPTVVADIPGMDYIDGKSGFIIPQGDEKALAEKVLILLNDPELRKRFSQTGRDYTVKNASWQAVADRTKEIFERIK